MGRMTRMFYEKKSVKSAQSAFGFWICTVEKNCFSVFLIA